MLHTVNKSPFEKDALASCLRLAGKGSSILLFEDGIYAALQGTAFEEQMKAAVQDHSVFVLGPDLHARGFSDDRVINGIDVVDYGAFVDLVAENDKVQAWL